MGDYAQHMDKVGDAIVLVREQDAPPVFQALLHQAVPFRDPTPEEGEICKVAFNRLPSDVQSAVGTPERMAQVYVAGGMHLEWQVLQTELFSKMCTASSTLMKCATAAQTAPIDEAASRMEPQ